MNSHFDFILDNRPAAGAAFRALNIYNFQSACDYTKRLPFLKTSNRDDFTIVLKEQKGTCSVKHGLLKQLAEENNIADWKLFTCIYHMTAVNTPAIKDILINNHLFFFPETHSYLKFDGRIFDFTFTKDISAIYKPTIVAEYQLTSHDLKHSKNMEYYFDHLQVLQKKDLSDFNTDHLLAIRNLCWEEMAS